MNMHDAQSEPINALSIFDHFVDLRITNGTFRSTSHLDLYTSRRNVLSIIPNINNLALSSLFSFFIHLKMLPGAETSYQ